MEFIKENNYLEFDLDLEKEDFMVDNKEEAEKLKLLLKKASTLDSQITVILDKIEGIFDEE